MSAWMALRSDRGPVRSTNQDAACLRSAITPVGEVAMAVVCDGVGGLSCGEVASTTVACWFARWFEEELQPLVRSAIGVLGLDAIQESWTAKISTLNEVLRTYAKTHGSPLGTTFTGLITLNNNYLVGHVGDSRAYKLNGRSLEQLTQDQTLLAYLDAQQADTATCACLRQQRNAILQAVGARDTIEPAFYEGSFEPGDVFLLCSDGAYRTIGNEGLQATFCSVDTASEQQLDRLCKAVVESCVKRGERDNLTIACVSFCEQDACAGEGCDVA